MALITLERASKHYGERAIFSEVNFSINEGERLGLVGVNGGGKSTLLALLGGGLGLDHGERRARVGGLRRRVGPRLIQRLRADAADPGRVRLVRASLGRPGFPAQRHQRHVCGQRHNGVRWIQWRLGV